MKVATTANGEVGPGKFKFDEVNIKFEHKKSSVVYHQHIHSGDIFAEDSIELLKTSGIDFDKFEKDGIDVQYFGELLTMSGLVLNDKVKWVSFHSSYDFGYLLKLLTCTELPLDEQSFLDILHIFFPNIFDIKVSKF